MGRTQRAAAARVASLTATKELEELEDWLLCWCWSALISCALGAEFAQAVALYRRFFRVIQCHNVVV